MSFDGLKLALVLISGVASFIAWMREKDLIKAGGEQAIAAALRKQADDIQKADAAREAERSELARDPGRLREDDGFFRPD